MVRIEKEITAREMKKNDGVFRPRFPKIDGN